MSAVNICRCPSSLLQSGLELALADVASDQHGAIVEVLRPLAEQGVDVFAGLVVAVNAADKLVGAGWLQPQVGRTATLWPPNFVSTPEAVHKCELARAAVDSAPHLPVDLAQCLLEESNDPFAGHLQALGFTHLAELNYLMLRVSAKRVPPPQSTLTLQPSAASDFNLFKRLLIGTYESTLDCPALAGLRQVEDVVAGYQAIGTYDDSLWFVVHWEGQPAGLLLLATYPEHSQWELVYMGVLPQFRGRAIGSHVLAELHSRASRSGIDSIVLAVDSTNAPAINMYARAGFVEWTRRSAYIKPIS